MTIGHGAGRALLSTLTCGPMQLTIGRQAGYREGAAANIVGVIPGTEDGEVILSAHYDSQAEGVCILQRQRTVEPAETARALRDTRPRRRICWCHGRRRKVGVWGATAYVERSRDDCRTAVAMVNLDGIASAYPAHREIWSVDADCWTVRGTDRRALGWRPDVSVQRRSTFGDQLRSATRASPPADLAA